MNCGVATAPGSLDTESILRMDKFANNGNSSGKVRSQVVHVIIPKEQGDIAIKITGPGSTTQGTLE